MKKIILLIILFLNFVSVQNSAFSAEQNIYVTAYLVRLQNKVKKNWDNSYIQPGSTAVVTIELDKNGNIVHSSVSQSSDDKSFDEMALSAVSKSEPFEKFPQNINDENVKISFEFSKNLTEAKQILDEKKINVAVQKNNEMSLAQVRNSDKCQKCNTKKIVKNSDFAPYIQALQIDIKSNWAPPRFNKRKVAITSFTVDKNGGLSDLKIYKSSGSKSFDKKALEAISLTAPFAPLPEDFSVNSIDIKFAFNYNLKRSNSERTNLIFNNYYFVPSDFSSPVTKIWAVDKVVWWTFLVLKICSPSI